MTKNDIDRIKKISIRGRVAYGLICLEHLKSKVNNDLNELNILIEKCWDITNSEKIGWWQNMLIENNPILMLADYELMINGEVTFEEIGLDTINHKSEFIKRIEFLSQINHPIDKVINKLTTIANQNISAGCGEFSELTLEPTIELIELVKTSNYINLPKIEIVEFSKFSENNGWGDKFDRTTVIRQKIEFNS